MWPNQSFIDQLEGQFGPFEEHTRTLLNTGYDVQPHGFLSGPRILLAAIHLNGFISALHRIPDLQYLGQQLQRPEFDQALREWVTGSASALPGDSPCSHAFLTAIGRARADAGPGASLWWYNLLLALMIHDTDVGAVLNSLNGNPHSYPSAASRTPITGQHHAVHSDLGLPPVRQESTTTLRYRYRHKKDMDQVIHQIAQRGPDEVIVVRGMHGSPLERLPKVLADILADPSMHEHTQRLAGYTHVLKQDVGRLHAAAINSLDAARDALLRAIARAESQQAILILTRGERLASKTPANDALLSALLDPGPTPIIISYTDANEEDARVPINLNFIRFLLVEIAPYSIENTRNALPEYYGDYLAANGLSLSLDAFDSLYALEPGIYMQVDGATKRKTLPYLAADLLTEVVDSVLREPNSVGIIGDKATTARDRAKALVRKREEGRQLITALVELDKVIERGGGNSELIEDAKRMVELWAPRWELIKSIPDEMELFASDPVIALNTEGQRVITKEIVTAQLVSEAAYHIQYWLAFKRSLEECDPDLQSLLSRAV